MASLVLDSIRSALNSLERSEYSIYYSSAKRKLKNLEIFVLCARKSDNYAQLRFDDDKVSIMGPLLQRIHDVVSAHQFPLYRYDWEILTKFQSKANDFEEEMGHWYKALSDFLPQQTFHEVLEIIDTVLEALDFVLGRFGDDVVTAMESMVEKITFLRNFIRFAILPSVEPWQLESLLVHSQVVSVNAAQLYYNSSKEKMSAVKALELVQKINSINDFGVYEMYTKALISSKLLTPSADHDPWVTMKDFIDSLLWKLWEWLQMDTRIAISTRVQLQLLYEGLRLLRCMLNEQRKIFDEEVRDLSRVVICEAGILIFSLNENDVEEIVVPISDLMQRINHIRQDVEGKDISISNLRQRFDLTREGIGGNDLPRTNELGFMDVLLENLEEMTSSKACYGFRAQFQMIHDHLFSLRCSLGEIEVVRNKQKELETLWNAGIKVAYRVEFLIDQFVFRDFQGSFSAPFDSSVEEILEEIKSTISEIHHASESDVKVKKVSKTSNLQPARSSVVPIADEIVGFDDGAEKIINRLTRGSKQLKTVAIVGMPGIGKTTLAAKVFSDPYVTFHFHKRAICCVSQSFDRKKVLLELLNHIDPNKKFEMERDLADMLRRRLKGESYLIFLDDVWDIEVWNCLKQSFPDDSCGSRIMLTSRHCDVASLLDEEPHFVRQLTDEESWELLQKKLFHGIDCTLELCELGKQIATHCKGLPLTVVVVAGLLANMEAEGWKKVLENISSISSFDDHCMNTLELSYKHLPDYLKPCFLYFGLFPEDHQVSVKRLIWLWIAEGFVLKTELKSLEDVARDYMMDLVGRSLVIVSKRRSIGGVKACQIHDLLHDFCRIKAKEEKFFELLKGYDELMYYEEPNNMRRLCVRSKSKHFKKLRLFCPRMHSLLFFALDEEQWREHDISFIIPRYNRVRVLDIGQYRLGGIPSEIAHFLQLKYLSVRGDIWDIPSSIGSLTNLETLILYSNKTVSLPNSFWNLKKLRHLGIQVDFHFPTENLESAPDLCELESCSTALIGQGESIESLIRKFPNIRRLSCLLLWEGHKVIYVLASLSRLELLSMSHYAYMTDSLGLSPMTKFYLLTNLRKLTLENCWLHQSEISTIGQLHNLEVLKLDRVDFLRHTWDMVEGEFSRVRFLRLKSSNVVTWTGSDDQFSSLQKLVLEECGSLEVIPFCFADLNTLEMIRIRWCSYSVNRFFERIQDEQIELGNLELKIHIS